MHRYKPLASASGPAPSPAPAADVGSQPPIRPGRRRDKPQMSCNSCRQKKLKCNRAKPCFHCARRGFPESCEYVNNLPDPRTLAPGQAQAVRSAGGQQVPVDVRDRIRHLENLVTTLLDRSKDGGAVTAITATNSSSAPCITTTSSPPEPKTSPPEPKDDGFAHSPALSHEEPTAPGVPKASRGRFTQGKTKDQENFVVSDHWEAILEEISDLKIDLDKTETSETTMDSRARLLFGSQNRVSRTEIISSLPPRATCDKLLACWFNVMELPSLVVHAPTFLKEYEQMWKDFDGTPLMWFGLLFSILGLACHFQAKSGEELPDLPAPFANTTAMANHYRDRTAQCLIEVNYLKPVRYTINTLCFYYLLDVFRAKDSEFGGYVILGMIVRVAMRLGYHRDASHYPSISIFDGEMRRRTWAMIFQFDLATSAAVGLPRMIRDDETNTAEPRNLLDADLHEGMTELPHPRLSTDVTPIAYAIFKTRLSRKLGLIMDQINAVTPAPYQEIMRLDAQLVAIHATLPPYLNMRPLCLSLADRADLIMRRFSLEECFQKSRCILHRKYLIPGQTNPLYSYSRTASIDAAMKLLAVQISMYEASQPGSQLAHERWRMGVLMSPDFALAAIILCLDLDWASRVGNTHLDDEVEKLWPRAVRLQNLKGSHEIWAEACQKSKLAAKAAEVLRVMLIRLNPTKRQNNSAKKIEIAVATSQRSADSDLYPSPFSLNTQPIPTDSFSDEMNLDPYIYSDAPAAPGDSLSDPNAWLSEMMQMDTDANYDWGFWDAYFQAPTQISPLDLGPSGDSTGADVEMQSLGSLEFTF